MEDIVLGEVYGERLYWVVCVVVVGFGILGYGVGVS